MSPFSDGSAAIAAPLIEPIEVPTPSPDGRQPPALRAVPASAVRRAGSHHATSVVIAPPEKVRVSLFSGDISRGLS
jgi:hypothetical protein